jgi:hypothetical protein
MADQRDGIAAGWSIIGLTNYAVPSAISFAPSEPVPNVVLAGVVAILPFASDGLVNGLVATLFCFGPCTLLRLGFALFVLMRN